MADKLVQQLLENRAEFVRHLRTDVAKTEEIIASTSAQLQELRLTSLNVQELGQKVEHSALIPLGKRIYVNGNIVHTGEYFLDKVSFPNSYTVLDTLNSTIQHLEMKIKRQSEVLKKTEEAKLQLEKRIGLIISTSDDDDKDLPQQIVSDKGVAVKTGDFYEIVEFEA